MRKERADEKGRVVEDPVLESEPREHMALMPKKRNR